MNVNLDSVEFSQSKESKRILSLEEKKELSKQLSSHWQLVFGGKELLFRIETINMKEGMTLAQKVFDLAEELKHHPDILICYRRFELCLCTHDIGNDLCMNDFVMAYRIDQLL